MFVDARTDKLTISIVCPNCKMSARHMVSYVEDVIHDGLDIACVACNQPFGVVTVSRNATNRRCPACNSLLEERSVYCDNCGTDTPRHQ
jgi:hypothetical protein